MMITAAATAAPPDDNNNRSDPDSEGAAGCNFSHEMEGQQQHGKEMGRDDSSE